MSIYLSISEAAEYLGISKQTLRRWDESGHFKASYVTPGGHRQYALSDLARLGRGIYRLALDWASADEPIELPEDFYCPNSELFRIRLEKMAVMLDRNDSTKEISSLVTSVAGEIGNNSFDHNIGNWPDILGSFFAYDLGKRILVLADRGRGIKKTLQVVRPNIVDDAEALRVAFTEIVTGRSPEHRGNGLKYARKVIVAYGLTLKFLSGDSELEIAKRSDEISIRKASVPIRGCLALIEF
ncbi:helix-turn-helix domain-containing protein [Patescibacteria group bacterium]|nr:helix-turn-helix domain-containing protein [Patescibacteria group bacterium]MBU1029128.1 helix-turn-helix domain-containing protein [Patescibacteria group bacterium]